MPRRPRAASAPNATFSRDLAAPVVARVRKVTARKDTIPILSSILVASGPEKIHFVATDLDQMIDVEIPATVAASFRACVDARMLEAALKRFPEDGTVSLTEETDGEGVAALRLVCGRARVRLAALPEADFPRLDVGRVVDRFEIAGTVLADALRTVAPAMSDEETRYYLCGVHMAENRDGDLAFAATDGHRLHRKTLDMPEDAGGLAGVIIPRATIDDLAPLAGEAGEAPVTVEIGETLMRVAAPGATLTTKLVDGKYPDYERIIPPVTDASRTVVVGTDALAAALASALVAAPNKDSRMVTLRFSGETIDVSASRGDGSEAAADLDAALDGAPLTIGVNGGYLIDALDQIPGGTADLTLADPETPIRVSGEHAQGVTIIVMPMRLGKEPETADSGEGKA